MLNHYSSNLNNLFQWATAISLHMHVTNETNELVNKDLLSLVKDLYLVNTSRGAVVNEQDIVEALKNGNLAGYGTDVLIDENGVVEKALYGAHTANHIPMKAVIEFSNS